ncbi:MAG: radical SAM protein [Planctomycetota bacterium]
MNELSSTTVGASARGYAGLATLPAPKAQLARRRLLAGAALTPAEFSTRGLDLSADEATWLKKWCDAGLESSLHWRETSADGTHRLVLSLAPGDRAETVVMPNRSACVSTQVGCAVGCRFCASGAQGLARNLEAGEIVEQVVWARRQARVDRVVFMGMGEPTHNLPGVLPAIDTLRHDGLISPRKLTLSTVGSVRALERLRRAPALPCLALSLHTADPNLRAELLPGAPRESLADLVEAADAYARVCGTPVQFQCTLLHGVNDRDEDADALCDLLEGTRGYVNLIPWNAVDGAPFARPPRDRIVAMVRRIKARGILATIRDSAGADVAAACGQLAVARPARRAAQPGR